MEKSMLNRYRVNRAVDNLTHAANTLRPQGVQEMKLALAMTLQKELAIGHHDLLNGPYLDRIMRSVVTLLENGDQVAQKEYILNHLKAAYEGIESHWK